ncbi:signal peptidase I [archaeon]|nr:signal peptidase I [archaeon]
MTSKLRSPLWYELPLLFQIIGGIMSFLLIRNDDPVKAKRCLILGIILTAIPLLAIVGIFGIIGSTTTFVIASDSMDPELMINDVVMVDEEYPFEQIKMGDIIVFNRPSDHDRVIAHRVVTILDDDPKTLKTKGDANTTSIQGTDFPVTEKEYIGKIVNVIPQLGEITNMLKPPTNYLILLISLGILIIPVMLHIRFRQNIQQAHVQED